MKIDIFNTENKYDLIYTDRLGNKTKAERENVDQIKEMN